MGYTVAVVGATGAVGAQMIKMLEGIQVFQLKKYAIWLQYVQREETII